MFHKILQKPDDRPAFTQIVEESQLTINGYTLQLNPIDQTASIINLKKGGNKSMLKKVVKALEGFEDLYDKVSEMKENLEAEKQEAIKIAVAEVEERYAEKSAKIDEVFAQVSETEEVEVPDEEVVAEPVSEEVSEGEAQEVISY